VFVNSVILQLPRLVAKGAGLEPGHQVIIDVTGPVMARVGVRVETDEQGRPRGHAMLSGDSAFPSDRQPDRETTTISLSTEAFTRRAAGRRSFSSTACTVVGDEPIARRVMEALVVTF
jgi:hypothetical protein